MIKIKRISYKNFQSHADSTLELGEGVNVIAGNSDKGKTSLLRGVELVRINRPLGDGFISYWADKAEVEMVVEGNDGKEHIIKRIRGKNENKYLLDGEPLDALKGRVPEEVESLLNLSDINIQNQLQEHFLILDSPGEIARMINSLLRLDLVDEKLSNFNSKRLQAKKDIKAITSKLDEYKMRLESREFNIIEELEPLVEEYDSLFDLYEKEVLKEEKLGELLDKINETEKELQELLKINKYSGLLSELKEMIDKYNELASDKDELFDSIRNIKLLEEDLKYFKELVKDKELVGTGIVLVVAYKDKKERIEKLTGVVNEINDLENYLEMKKAELSKIYSERDTFVKGMNECLFCKSKLTKQTRDNLLESLYENRTSF